MNITKRTISKLLIFLIAFALFSGLLLSHAVKTQAATISVSTSAGTVHVGDTVTVTVTINGNKIGAYSGNMGCNQNFSGFTGVFVQDCSGEMSVSFSYEYKAVSAGQGKISVTGVEVAVDDPQDPTNMIKEKPGDAECTITVLEKESQAGWVKKNNKWYYVDKSGGYVKGWIKDGNIWYYLDQKTGVMQTGWVKVSGIWYYMNSSGAMQTGWVKVSGTWYYMNSSGAMQTGWINDGGTWYYLKPSGAMAANEWVPGYYWLSSNGAWRYPYVGFWELDDIGWWFGDTSGWYAADESVRINGVWYQFDPNGYWIG